MRAVRASERRAFGTLKSVECGANGVLIRVGAEDEVFDMAARRLSDVEVISYRTGVEAALTCGVQPQAIPVFATFIEQTVRLGDAEIDYVVTAVEFLPDGFEPK